jgi:hypothetical protein
MFFFFFNFFISSYFLSLPFTFTILHNNSNTSAIEFVGELELAVELVGVVDAEDVFGLG